MCGLAKIVNIHHDSEISTELVEDMIEAISHSGPDGFGFYRDKKIGLALSPASKCACPERGIS